MSAFSPPLIGTAPASLRGHCARCRREHVIELDPGLAATTLWAWWQSLHAPDSVLGHQLHEVGGKMIAVLVSERPAGDAEISYAISGDLFGNPHVPGCVPPVIQHERFAALETITLRELADIERAQQQCEDPKERAAWVQKRREASRRLMKAIIDTTTLCNRRGVELPLPEVFVGRGIPSGTADCALPKLLHWANRKGQLVKAIAEVWFGPPAGERLHGLYSEPCQIRCAPILGHLLCDAHA